MKKVIVYTDGACSRNPGPGGWAAVLQYKGAQKEISGYMPDTTNNRMELMGAIMALEALKEPCEVVLHTDSAYVHNAFQQRWIDRWQRNGWRTASNDPVENSNLWRQLLDAAEPHTITWVKVKGHADNELNNLCDKLARKQITDNNKTSKAEKEAKNTDQSAG